MRGAGCTVNDLWDKDFDAKVTIFRILLSALHFLQVARTQMRPLARGDCTPSQSFAFLAAQSAIGLGVLTQLNNFRLPRFSYVLL